MDKLYIFSLEFIDQISNYKPFYSPGPVHIPDIYHGLMHYVC